MRACVCVCVCVLVSMSVATLYIVVACSVSLVPSLLTRRAPLSIAAAQKREPGTLCTRMCEIFLEIEKNSILLYSSVIHDVRRVYVGQYTVQQCLVNRNNQRERFRTKDSGPTSSPTMVCFE